MPAGEAGPRFDQVELVGVGGTARVERARLQEPFAGLPAGAEVAIKTLHAHLRGNAELEEAFRAEAEAARSIEDPSIVRVIHHGVHGPGPDEGLSFLVMSFVPGRTLREVLDQEGPSPSLCCAVSAPSSPRASRPCTRETSSTAT